MFNINLKVRVTGLSDADASMIYRRKKRKNYKEYANIFNLNNSFTLGRRWVFLKLHNSMISFFKPVLFSVDILKGIIENM